MPEKQRVLDANNAFYTAFGSLNFDAMDGIWAKRRDVSVCHPNQPGIGTRDAVMESWYKILATGQRARVTVFDQTVIMTRKSALVICREDIGGTQLIATNVFVLEDGEWRMTHHQASRLPARARQSDQFRRRKEKE